MMNMEEIYKIETIEQYNNMYGFKTMHPLVAYVEFNESNSKFIPGRHTMGFYSLFLRRPRAVSSITARPSTTLTVRRL